MNSKLIEDIANAVLYEGYMLYPYRPSAVKNQQRWNFGVVYPRPYSEIQTGTDAWFMQTQCLIRGNSSSIIDVKVRCLQAVSRRMGKLAAPRTADNSEPNLELVELPEVGSKALQSWQEAIEQDVALPSTRLADLLVSPVRQLFAFTGGRELEPTKDDFGSAAAFISRAREEISGSVELSAEECGAELFRITVLISNLTALENPGRLRREEVLLKSLLSTHTVLGVRGAEFLSLIDPPPGLQEVASGCKNVGTWPVLAGEGGCKDAMLSSPIILYDYPQIAPESAGNLFDGTEIDEILALRILTLSDDEKREIRETDERAREVLDRTETMPTEHFLKLHGVLRGMKAAGNSGDEPAPGGER
jgi:hydrogenase maturation protease